jgi:2-polyprenyl-6-methoxyphenol hydroxylase-like FAD-dependent oxidoreductase
LATTSDVSKNLIRHNRSELDIVGSMSPSTKPIQKVLVVGGGIGGLGAATALTQQGVETEIIEIEPEANVYGVGINQPGNSLRALRSLGVLDEACAVGYQFGGWDFHDADGNLVVGVDNHVSSGDIPENNGLSRRDLHTILIGAAVRGGVPIHYGTTIAELHNGPDEVTVTLSDGTSKTYDLVAGFDGIRSPLRRELFGTAHDPVYAGVVIWRVTIPKPPTITRGALFQAVGAKAGYIPLSEESMYLFLVTPEPKGQRLTKAESVDALRERLAGFSGVVGDIRDNLKAGDDVVYSPLNEVMLPAPWSSGRVVVCGDAAHACAPHLTQGAAMALEDAVVLADEVAKQRQADATLAAFTERRYPRANFVQMASRGILDAEMSVTRENLDSALEHMREALPGQFAHVDSFLAQPA